MHAFSVWAHNMALCNQPTLYTCSHILLHAFNHFTENVQQGRLGGGGGGGGGVFIHTQFTFTLHKGSRPNLASEMENIQ